MRRVAAAAGYAALIAPVRPTWKERYPLIPLERYAHWRRDDGLPFDPWIRLHVRLGAELAEVCPESMRVTGTVAEWEEWTGMHFPEDGDYVVPGALVPVTFAEGLGVYVEPNVWMRHPYRLTRPREQEAGCEEELVMGAVAAALAIVAAGCGGGAASR